MSLYICKECVQDSIVKRINDSFALIDTCYICQNKNQKVADIQNDSCINNYANLLLRYHFDDSEYYGENAIQNIASLLLKHNLLFNTHTDFQQSKCEEICQIIFKHDNEGKAVNFNTSPITKAIKNNSEGFLQRRLRRFHFGYPKLKMDIDQIFDSIKPKIREIALNNPIYRARIGSKKLKVKNPYSSNNAFEIEKNGPLSEHELGAPPNEMSTSGRANRAGLSFFYGAENEETAIEEVRANPGDYVSIGKFLPDKKLRIFDLYEIDLFDYSSNQDEYEMLEYIACLQQIFSYPKGSYNNHYYLATQLFSEKIWIDGYDGICYKSAFTGLTNYAIFNPEKMKMVDNSALLIRIMNVKSEYTDIFNST